MKIESIGVILFLSIPVFMVIVICLGVVAGRASRNGFGRYLRDHHPEMWSKLVPHSDLAIFDALASTADVNSAVRRFRTLSDDDLGDPNLRVRRERANRLEKIAVLGFLGLIGWVGIVAGALLVIG